MRSTLPRALCALVIVAACAPAPRETRSGDEPRRPNILFLLTDDQRADTIAALGNPRIKTPNLDSLAESGLVFRNAYGLGSNVGATCTPSRNMLLSGRAYFRYDGPLASGRKPNLPASLKAIGYETYYHGKRRNTATAIQRRFEHRKYLPDREDLDTDQPGKAIVDDALEFLRSRTDDRPWLLYLAFAAPHDPRVAAPEWLAEYDPDDIPLPRNYVPVHPFDNGEMTIRDERLVSWPRPEEEIRRHLRDYWAVITALDHHIGRLLQALKDLGEYDRTIVVFSSDSGLALGSHGLLGKQSLYDHSIKSPLIFVGPGIRRGRSDDLVYLLDVFPTLCELVGAPVPDGLDGESLAPVLRGEPYRGRDSLFLAYRRVMRAVRDERWKLIRYPHLAKNQLFDLANDPDEIVDLANDPAQSERIERMTGMLREWQSRFGDDAPLTWETLRDSTFTPPEDEPGRWRRGRGRRGAD